VCVVREHIRLVHTNFLMTVHWLHMCAKNKCVFVCVSVSVLVCLCVSVSVCVCICDCVCVCVCSAGAHTLPTDM
jgi:hypothetical protein